MSFAAGPLFGKHFWIQALFSWASYVLWAVDGAVAPNNAHLECDDEGKNTVAVTVQAHDANPFHWLHLSMTLITGHCILRQEVLLHDVARHLSGHQTRQLGI
jgi:hypothetical protein